VKGSDHGEFPTAARQTRPSGPDATVWDAPRPADGWSAELTPRLLAPPARWGWETVAPVEADTAPAPLPDRLVWIEPPRPDTSALRDARSKAVSRVVWRLSFMVLAMVAFSTYQLTIEQNVDQLGGSARQVYGVALIVVAGLFAIGVLRALAGVRYASRSIQAFEQPYRVMRDTERQRHQEALSQWNQAVRRHAEIAAAATRSATLRAGGPQWFPVRPVSEPTRVDVFGGDPRRHGWASLLVMVGTSLLAAGQRMTVLDFTGQEVGDNLAAVARTAGIPVRAVRFGDGTAPYVDLFDGLAPWEIAECLGEALTGRPEGDVREERALATDTLRRVVERLDPPVTFARLAAGVRVLIRGTGDERLSDTELDRLAAAIGDVDQNEWTTRQLRFLASRLDLLDGVAPAGTGGPLWTADMVTLISTEGGRGDRKELLDRLLLGLVRPAMPRLGGRGDFLVVAGADHLGAAAVRMLSEQARNARVRLMLMIDQPQGDLERSAGTGGAVCLMKMYNHRDASIAAEFIGREHRFVMSQLTRQVGTTFTDGGGDSFAASTNSGQSTRQRWSGVPGRPAGLSDSRGHTWTGTRNWSSADNVSTSSATSRVHEFTIDPQQVLNLPNTAFILVDNTGPNRRVVLADCNPGLCEHPRVSAQPLGEVR
jgi:hypothetical protein